MNDRVRDPLILGLAARVKEHRERKGLSISRLAQTSGVVPAYISQIESGKRPNPGAETLLALARGLRISLDELVGYDASALPEPGDEDARYAALESKVDRLTAALERLVLPKPKVPARAARKAPSAKKKRR